MTKRTIGQVDVAGRRVLMRVDFNVPLDAGGAITDDRRVRAALPSMRSVIDRGGRLVLISHLGRPAGQGLEPAFSLRSVAERLDTLLDGVTVRFAAGACVGDAATAAVAALGDGDVLLLDNLRFDPREKSGDTGFAAALAAFADIYCNEAFGTAHRNDASMFAVPQAMAGKPRVCGFLLEKELRFLARALDDAAARRATSDVTPGAKAEFVALLGGAKVSDKLGAIRNLIGRVDAILVGGAMAYTFLAARGVAIGASRVEPGMIDEARGLLDAAGPRGTDLALPTDHVAGREPAYGTTVQTFEESIDDGWMGLDIGPATTARFAGVVRGARTIIWNGPMGMFEVEPFDTGTRAVAEALADATGTGAVSIVGGGDSAAAIEAFGLADRVSHVSTGGGASLRMLEGRSFESVGLLDDAVESSCSADRTEQ